MTTYDTTSLAQAIIGEEAVERNRKAATRTLRKFLRTDFAARELQTPGKGGRYAIEMNKTQLKAMTKRFAAWEVQQEEEKAKRQEALAARKAPKADPEPETPETDNEAETDTEDDSDDTDMGDDPDEADLDAMIREMQDEDNED